MAEFGVPPPTVIVTDRELALMNALSRSDVFSTATHLLCVWHIFQKVAQNCKIRLHIDEWTILEQRLSLLFKSNTEQIFASNWGELERLSADDSICTEGGVHEREPTIRVDANGNNKIIPPRKDAPKTNSQIYSKAYRYIARNWYQYRQKFVTCWTNHHRHYGNVTTSRTEGTHHVLKSWLPSSTGDLFSVYKAFKLALNAQREQWQVLVAQERLRSYFQFGRLYDNLRYKVSKFALDHIH
jgi:hypothetical protein